jgi:hypothetical protein
MSQTQVLVNDAEDFNRANDELCEVFNLIVDSSERPNWFTEYLSEHDDPGFVVRMWAKINTRRPAGPQARWSGPRVFSDFCGRPIWPLRSHGDNQIMADRMELRGQQK